jgi:hypothetical protein
MSTFSLNTVESYVYVQLIYSKLKLNIIRSSTVAKAEHQQRGSTVARTEHIQEESTIAKT